MTQQKVMRIIADPARVQQEYGRAREHYLRAKGVKLDVVSRFRAGQCRSSTLDDAYKQFRLAFVDMLKAECDLLKLERR